MTTLSKHHFWEWFKRHHNEYLSLKSKSRKEGSYWLNELNAHLRAYFKFFGFSLEMRKERLAILTITVNGKSKHFKKADDFVAKAPKIEGWKIIALEPSRPIEFLLEEQIENTGVDPREFFFSFASEDPNHAGLIIYHPLYNSENAHLIYQLANDAVYNLLGERSFGTDIGWLRVANLSDADPGNVNILEALPEFIGLRSSVMSINARGKLIIVD